jgi:transcriptional regulator GlxA family with amidase domain
MRRVTVLFLHDGCASAAVAPFEVFRFAGVLFNMCVGTTPQPRFDVVAASLDGQPPVSDGGIAVVPQKAIRDIRETDLIFIPDAGFEPRLMIDKHRALIPWLRKLHAGGSMIAAVCSGVGILAATGLLDGRRATTHWAMTEPFRQLFPEVEWRTDVFITEDRGIFTGGSIYSSIDLSLYLVEKFCGHTVAVECAKALLIDMPRTWQTEYAVLPLTTSHTDDAVRRSNGCNAATARISGWRNWPTGSVCPRVPLSAAFAQPSGSRRLRICRRYGFQLRDACSRTVSDRSSK